jgi:hypothetical protein
MTNSEQRLLELTDRLRRGIATAPARSYTAREAADQLAFFTSPTCVLTTAEKVRALTATLDGFRRGLQFDDVQRHHPGDRPRDG